MNQFKDFQLEEWGKVWKENLGKSAMAIWKLPQSDKVHLIIDQQGGIALDHKHIEQLKPGFVVSTFSGQLRYLNAKAYYIADFPQKTLHQKERVMTSEETEKLRYAQLVEETLTEISKKEFEKVVLSRKKSIPLQTMEIGDLVVRLGNLYPDAFVSVLSLPEDSGIWVGCSPEILVSQNKEGILKTYSLAGTQVADMTVPLNQVRWGQKEIEEQAFVSRYIIDCFKKIRLREYEELGPKTVLAGNLWHLRTEFQVHTELLNYSQLASTLLDLLHPTSAVCGTPKSKAMNWILKKEGYDRKYYTGFLGPINFDSEIHLYVNLRTVELTPDGEGFLGHFYAGAGITEDSIPEKEWEETEYKIHTLFKGL